MFSFGIFTFLCYIYICDPLEMGPFSHVLYESCTVTLLGPRCGAAVLSPTDLKHCLDPTEIIAHFHILSSADLVPLRVNNHRTQISINLV